jgi:transposase
MYARSCVDDEEDAKLRKLSGAQHAPADWVVRATIVTMSQAGSAVPQIAAELGWDPRTVRKWVHRFNADGVDGLADRGGQGRKPRITQQERSQIIALVATVPPGRLQHDWTCDTLQQADPDSTITVWTLDALAQAAQQQGIQVGRSQVRRILSNNFSPARSATAPWTRSRPISTHDGTPAAPTPSASPSYANSATTAATPPCAATSNPYAPTEALPPHPDPAQTPPRHRLAHRPPRRRPPQTPRPDASDT